MVAMDLIDRVAIASGPTEADFHACWQANAPLAAGDAVDLAIVGGASADRFAWVFMSGYQAAVRSCFPEFAGAGWCCFAAAEPKQGPGCTLEAANSGYRLNGEKSWIAGASHLVTLVVLVGDGDARRFVRAERDAPGVSISLPRSPSFLAEMEQGAATFDAVAVAPASVLEDPARAYRFRAAEPLFVLLALNACLASHAGAAAVGTGVRAAAAVAIERGRVLGAHLSDRAVVKPGLVELRALTAATVAQFETGVLPQACAALQHSWAADGNLLRMFGVAESSA